jgi:hypothetical protein
MNKLQIPIIFILIFLISSCHSKSVEIYETKCGNLETPVGVSKERLKFSWKLKSEKQDVLQTVYQIIVADDLNKLNSEEGLLWNSGKVESDASIQVAYEGKALVSAKKYFWKVKVWDNEGVESDWSDPTYFVTALFNEKDWSNAKWLVYEEMPESLRMVPGIHGLRRDFNESVGKHGQKRYVTPYFRKEFALTKKIKNAFVAVSGLGHYELSLNGEKVSNRFLAPGWTNYDKTCLYNMYEVTDQLQKGENALGALVGNGFYNINTERYIKFAITYGSPTLICKLKIEYEDGSEEVIVSDDTWKTEKSPITFTSIFGGEDYDANLEQEGWDTPRFEDEVWKNALVSDGPKGNLKIEMDYPLQVMEVFDDPFIKTPENTYLYDFKQNASGIVKLKVTGKKGQTLKLHPAERLMNNGLMNQRTSGTPVWFQYTLKGDEEEVWMPKFTYYGFRYVQIEGAVPEGYPNQENLPVITELQSLHTRNSSPTVGNFSCSNELFNRTYELIDWSVKSNLASVTTDCPHREKLGWLEVTHLMGNSIKYMYDNYNLYDKIVDDMIEAQTEDGLVTDIVPEYVEFVQGFRDSPEWGSSSVILPWYLYKWYGDMQAMKKAYPMMKRYMTYLGSKTNNHILDHGLGDWYDLGPTRPGPAQLTPKSLTATAIYYYDLSLVAKMAKMLGNNTDAKYYTELAEKVRIAFNDKFFDTDKKKYSTGSQTAYAMPLYFGMVDKEYEEEVAQNLAEELKRNNNALTSGDVGYRYLLQALQEAGYSDIIYKMNYRSDVPGYGYQLEKGATSLTESWKAEGASHNHMMLGHLMEWFYGALGGIKQAENSVAFRDIVIEPEIVGDVKSCTTSYNSPYGKIECEWKLDGNNGLGLNVEIPCNTTASVIIPLADGQKLLKNDTELNRTQYNIIKKLGKNKAVVKVGSGKYRFVVID